MNKLKLLPPFVTLSAGAITSIVLYLFQLDFLTMILILFAVLLVFYFLGVLAMKIIMDSAPKEDAAETKEENGEPKEEAQKEEDNVTT